MSERKIKRNERKKKKLEALLKITELNDNEREEFQNSDPHTPPSDTVEPEMLGAKKDKRKKAEEEALSTSQEDLNVSQDSLNGGEGDGAPRKKKKKKSKHESSCEESESKSKHKVWSDLETVEKKESVEDWPQLGSGDDYRHKRKTTFEADIHRERPVKMVKRYSEDYQRSYSRLDHGTNFADDLANFKKDLEHSKHKKEKKEKKRNKSLLETSETSDTPQTPDESMDSSGIQNGTEGEDIPANELDEMRKLLRDRKKQLKEIPMVRLKGTGKEADLDITDQQRLPILPCDVQNLLLLSQLGFDCPRFPRWIELRKYNRVCKTVVMVVEGVSAYDLMNEESQCGMLSSMEVKAEMVSPYCYNANFVEELCAVPLTREQKKTLEKRFGKEICPEALLTDKVIKVLRSAFSISSVPKTKSEEVEQKISVPTGDKFPRTELLLSAWQLIEEGYPLPYGSELGNRYPDYVMTKDEYTEVTPSSPLWALDCEMCLTCNGNELTRVSVVNEQHETVYESFCLPRNPIKNYLTEFSGITADMLKDVTTRIEDVQRDLRELFPADVILVGQSLGGDLHALKMMHPYVIDTSVIFNLTGNRKRKSKLSKLAKEFLDWDIQQRGADGHDSIEDSLAALKLVQHKLTKSIEYGDAVLSGFKETPTLDSKHDDANDSKKHIRFSEDTENSKEQKQKRCQEDTGNSPEHKAQEFDDLKVEVGPTMATSLFKHFTMKKKTVCVVGMEETLAEYSTFVAAAHRENKQLIHTQTTDNNQQTVAETCKQCKEHSFTLAHVVLGEEESITQVDSWMQQVFDSPPFNSLFITVLVGSHSNFANGAVLVKVKKPRLKLKSRKTE